MQIDTFANAIYLYDDKIVLTFNYHNGTKTITFDDVSAALSDKKSGSDLESSVVPNTESLMGLGFSYSPADESIPRFSQSCRISRRSMSSRSLTPCASCAALRMRT